MPTFARLKARLRPAYRLLKTRMQLVVLSSVSRSRMAASVYYGLFNSELSREARAMAAGQLRYARQRSDDARSSYQLRRNIHRIEKGLLMRPRRPIFGLDFIEVTVERFAQVARFNTESSPSGEIVWARDVLEEYFSCVDPSHPVVEKAYKDFQDASGLLKHCLEPGVQKSIPYKRDISQPPVSFDQFMALSRRRRSTRWFDGEKVDRGIIEKALAAAAQSPSACNRQPFHFRIFDEPERAAEITSIAMGTKGFAQNVPAVAAVVGQLRAYPFERDRHIIYIDGSLAAMSFMYALETLGLASCPINWPDQEPHESIIREKLRLEEDERVVMLIAFGQPDPDGKVAFSSKRETTEIARYD